MGLMTQDFLLSQLERLAKELIARLTRKQTQEEVARLAESVAGLSLETAVALPLEALLSLLTSKDGLEAEGAVALGLGLIALASDPAFPGAEELSARGRALVDAGLAARPSLRRGAVADAITALEGEERR